MNGQTPTLLYGSGAFGISLRPHYLAIVGTAWLERGGFYVEANLRGGGEFGSVWHQAAMKDNRGKFNADLIAVAEDLIEQNYFSSSKLAVRGGSGPGGLLMGNMYTLRPDLFGAICCENPVFDMNGGIR